MGSVGEELERLARLKASGDLTSAEYEALKARVLSEVIEEASPEPELLGDEPVGETPTPDEPKRRRIVKASRGQSSHSSGPPDDPPRVSETLTPDEPKRRKTARFAALTLTVLIAGVVAFFLIQDSSDEAVAPTATVPAKQSVISTTAVSTTTAAPTTTAPAKQSVLTTTTVTPAPTVAPAAPSGLGDGSLGTVEVGPGEAIQIRSLNAISGDVAFLGIPNENGIRMAVEDYGRISGHRVVVGTGLDDLCSADGGQAAAQTIVADEDVIGVIGTSCSGAATAASPLISAAGMVMISGSNTSPALTSDLAGTPGPNYHPGYYRTSHNDLYQGQAAANFALEVLGVSSAAAIHDGDPYTEGLARAFADAFEAGGGTLTGFTAVNKGDTDMVPVLTEIAAGSPDMLFFPIFQPEGDFIIQQSATVSGLGGTVMMAADGLLNSNYLAVSETEGMYFSGPDVRYGANFNQSTGETAADVLADYEAEFGEAPAAPFWAHSYDAAALLMDAILAASTDDGGTLVIDRADVREYLNGVSNYSGLIGSMSCDAYGDCSSAKITVIQNTDIADYAASTANVVYEYAPLGGRQASEVAVGATVGPLGGDLTMCRANWTSGYTQAEIVRQVLQSAGYGVSDPSAIELGPATAYMTMAAGECDLWANSWYPGHFSWYENELPDGSLVADHVQAVDGLFQNEGIQGYLVTKSWADANDITTLDQINDTPALYGALDTDGDGRGEILGCPEDWTCDDTIENQIAFAGWANLVQTKAGYDAMFAEFVNRVRAGQAAVIFTWTPSSYVVEMVPGEDVYWLSVENNSIFDDGLYSGWAAGQSQGDGFRNCTQPCQTGWKEADIQVSARIDVLEADPYLHALLEQIRPSIYDISILQVAQTSGDGSEAHVQWLAAEWMQSNESLVASWIANAANG